MYLLIASRYKARKGPISAERIAIADRKALDYLDTVQTVMHREDGPWIYGKHGPTALDAHFVVFLQRLQDAGHLKYFDELLDRYLNMATKTAEWKQVMQGRRTLPEVALVIRSADSAKTI